jgi:hypothetical protein
MHPQTVEFPDMKSIKATKVSAPAAWALMERNLFELMEQSARLFTRKYTERGGGTLLAEDLDDLYEQFYNYSLFYAMGAADDMLDIHLHQWNAATRISDDGIRHRPNIHEDFVRVYRPSIHNEFWNLDEAAEWYHLGEGGTAFYHMGLGDPTISENVRRARRFAAMFIGEDPEAPNWDPEHRILRSPFHSSQGPKLEADTTFANVMLLGGRRLGDPGNYYGVRASLYPIVEHLEARWFENPERKQQILSLFDKLVMQCDTPSSLGATALVTNAYLYTGDDRYKQWVLDYTEAWMERTQRNGGIVPDNVDANGVIGGGREGVWWGGQYGWTSYNGCNFMQNGINIGVECAQMLSGDSGYLDLLRSQLQARLDQAYRREDGQLVVPHRYGKDGWETGPAVEPYDDDGIGMGQWSYAPPGPMAGQEIMHLYHASMSREDYEMITHIRDGEVERDWNEVDAAVGEKNSGQNEFARFQYYDGKNPDWPEKILSAEYQLALEIYERIRLDERTKDEMIRTNEFPYQPVVTKGLTQVTMGAPQTIYCGGLLRATVRYFDQDRGRPGLPPDVAALVDELGPDRVGLQLVNTHRGETRNLIVQAGAFGEHQFTQIRYHEEGRDADTVTPIDAKYFAVGLPPSTSIRVEAGLNRFVNTPSYAFPWHGDKIPVPFQVP